MKIKDNQIVPPFETQKVTPRWEYIISKGRRNGPYLYLYWKEKGTRKLHKRYVGRSLEHAEKRETYQTLTKMYNLEGCQREHWTFRQWEKWEFLMEETIAKKNKLAEKYRDKVDRGEVSIDWAYRFLINKQLPKPRGYVTNKKLDEEIRRVYGQE